MRSRSASIALVCAVALAAGLGGCRNSNQLFEDNNEGGWFSKPMNLFDTPEWARTSNAKSVQLSPSGPVPPEEFVNADGSCAAASEPQPSSPPPAQASAPPPGDRLEPAVAAAPVPVLGGIALGMTECQVVRRAGAPTNISIGADDKGERRTVITYLTGTWPGIYTFVGGRMKIAERAPEPPKPVRPAPKKKPQAKTS